MKFILRVDRTELDEWLEGEDTPPARLCSHEDFDSIEDCLEQLRALYGKQYAFLLCETKGSMS